MFAVILAAGRGTRMGALTATVPKPLLTVGGRPIIEHIVRGLGAAGIAEAIVVTGYRGEQIQGHLGDGADLGMRLTYRTQETQDGTARALLRARDLIGNTPFVLSWGDVMVAPENYGAVVAEYRRLPGDALLMVNDIDDPWRGAAVYVNDEWRVIRLVEKPARGSSTTRWNNAGISVFAPPILRYAERLAPSSRGEYELPQAIAAMLADGLIVRALPVRGFWSDLGTPADLAAAEETLGLSAALPQVNGSGRIGAPLMPAALCTAIEGSSEVQRARALSARFRSHYGRSPTCIVRAPGRVNLLGEHTDYNGLPVLPMAIDRSIMVAVAPRLDRVVQLSNTAAQFPPRRYDLCARIPADAEGDWGNYSRAAAQGLVRYCSAALQPEQRLLGADLLVDGNIPSGAGLSSSSALVVANALALLAASNVEMAYEELAELLPAAERYVGTLSGGMDHAISLLARAGQALRIDFCPLRVRAVPLPVGYSVVVCHSLVQAEKSGAAKRAYNLRVIECRLACRALERALGAGLPRGLQTLGDLVATFPERSPADFLAQLSGLVPDRPLSLSEIAACIGTDPEQLAAVCEVTPEVGDRFALVRRVRHVLSEAERVNRAEEALRAGEALAFGQLMDASHGSCRDDYEISCAELEELIAVAKEAGAVGARLTGAGFGGCTVNLVPDNQSASFLTRIDRYFYRRRLPPAARVGDYRSIFRAHGAASVMRPPPDEEAEP